LIKLRTRAGFLFSGILTTMTIQQKIIDSIEKALEKLGVSRSSERGSSSFEAAGVEVELEHPAEVSHGDFSTNVALVAGKRAGKNPQEFALELIQELRLVQPLEMEKVEVAGPGFINFYLSEEFLQNSIKEITENPDFGKNELLTGKKILIEHTSPNAFKPLHIGHFMANTVGESVARLLEFSGSDVVRATYGSDIGLPTAKAVWGMMQLQAEEPVESDSLERKIEFIGNAYAHASGLYEKDEEIKSQIDEINIHIYKKDDSNLDETYQKGRVWSLQYLEEMYKKLDTKFDMHFYESEVFEDGSRIVKENLGKVFQESEGAIVFKGEDHGLHTRVFITSKGAPTYEAKEIGLHQKKSAIPFDTSIVVTGNEQAGVMQVGLKAFEQIDPDTARKTRHINHGLMLGTDGKKMSSRKGGALTAEELISTVKKEILKKVADSSVEIVDEGKTAEEIAIGALKYQILKQGSGKNIIFDINQALSFEGDSGPYLQYTRARTQSLLEKGKELSFEPVVGKLTEEAETLEKLLYRFPEVVARATENYAPQLVTTFLTEIAGAFNAYYAQVQVVDESDKGGTQARLALVFAVSRVLENGLRVLAMPIPEKM